MGTRFVGRGFTGCGKIQNAVILSEAKNLSSVCACEKKERFFASLRMTKQDIFSAACSAATQRRV
jgi:hypothetical protein